MSKKTVVIISLILAVGMLFTIVGSVAISGIYSLSASASDLNDKLNQNKQKQNELQSELAQTTKEKKQMQAQKETLDDDMAELATKIDSINRAIAKNNSDISEKQAEITNLEKNIKNVIPTKGSQNG